MDVYSSGNFWGHDRGDVPLKPIIVNQTFIWEDLEGTLPAIYVGDAGVVLDLCVRVPLDRLQKYYEKWNRPERLSALTDEDYEQMEQDNPCALDFRVGLTLDGVELQRRQMCATVWHPLELEEASVEEEAETLMMAYDCDRSSGWQFVRCMYQWKEKANPAPRNITLRFEGMQTPFTVGYFCTETACGEGQQIEVRHPVTGEKYTITLQGLTEERLSRETLEQMEQMNPRCRMEYPAYYQILSYRIGPESTPEELRICDCGKSDQPIMKKDKKELQSAAVSLIAGADGPTSIFMAGKSRDETLQTAMSALHFKPPGEVSWRIVFQIRKRRDMEINFEGGQKR